MIPIKSTINDCTIDPKAIKAYCSCCKSNHWRSSCWQCSLRQAQLVSYITTFQIDNITDPKDAVFAVRDHAAKKSKNSWLNRGALDVCTIP